jgi:hypothetical protein
MPRVRPNRGRQELRAVSQSHERFPPYCEVTVQGIVRSRATTSRISRVLARLSSTAARLLVRRLQRGRNLRSCTRWDCYARSAYRELRDRAISAAERKLISSHHQTKYRRQSQDVSVLILRRNCTCGRRVRHNRFGIDAPFCAGISSSPDGKHYARRDPWWEISIAHQSLHSERTLTSVR